MLMITGMGKTDVIDMQKCMQIYVNDYRRR